jgi:AcrR family transcriptional regulator
MPGNAVKRTRTRSAEGADVRTRILKAAHELFTSKGYHSTTTKEITARACVAEPTLFRHFGSKVDLFDASILEPFTAFVDRWSRSWVDYSAEASVEDLAENLVDSLYSLIREDRLVFQELMAARSDPTNDLYPAAVAVSGQLRNGLRAVHDAGIKIQAKRGLFDIDPPATMGAIASMIIGSVMFEDWVFPANKRVPGRTRMVREMTGLIVDGISHRRHR